MWQTGYAFNKLVESSPHRTAVRRRCDVVTAPAMASPSCGSWIEREVREKEEDEDEGKK